MTSVNFSVTFSKRYCLIKQRYFRHRSSSKNATYSWFLGSILLMTGVFNTIFTEVSKQEKKKDSRSAIAKRKEKHVTSYKNRVSQKYNERVVVEVHSYHNVIVTVIAILMGRIGVEAILMRHHVIV